MALKEMSEFPSQAFIQSNQQPKQQQKKSLVIRNMESHSFELLGILAIFCQALIPVDSSQGSHFWFSALQHEVLEADPKPLPGVIRQHWFSRRMVWWN